jgi:hypothetical protein
MVVDLGEPVLITATVTNEGSEPVKLIHHNAPTLLQSSLSVVALRLGGDEEHLKEWSDELRPRNKMEPKLLPPGESIAVDLVMLFNRKNGFFTESPGTYWISGRVATPGNRVEVFAPPVEIEVREPSPSDRSAWEWLDAHKEEYGRLVQVPWEAKPSEEFLEESAQLCDTSSSGYVEYLALFLSRSYREGPKKDAAQAARFAEIAKARASSEKIRAEAEKMVRADQPRPSPSGVAERELDPEVRLAVAQCVENFAWALTVGRMDECATWLS